MSSQTASVETGRLETDIPARLGRLAWAKFHWMVVIGLGTVWNLFRIVGARRWGPGRFRRALGEAVASGRIRRTARGRFEPPEPGT